MLDGALCIGFVANEAVRRIGLVQVVLQRRELEPIEILVGEHVDGVVLGADRRIARNFCVFCEAHLAIITD